MQTCLWNRRLRALLWIVCCAAAATRVDATTVTNGTLPSGYGCELTYEYHQPAGTAIGEPVILAHGFMRKLSSMRGWAEHWAQLGIPTAIINFCNASLIDGKHELNARDMIALREILGLEAAIYAGFSSGGLAAYLAALLDPNATAYLGLDSVDSDQLARTAEGPLKVPALFMIAPPSSCNARNNFDHIVERWPAYTTLRIPQASHCHFEFPYDSRCDWVCGDILEENVEEVQRYIRQQATDWLLQQAKKGEDS